MANLHVQPKRRNNAWLWILILVIIIAAAIYYFEVYKKQAPANSSVFQLNTSSQLKSVQLPAAPKTIVEIKSC